MYKFFLTIACDEPFDGTYVSPTGEIFVIMCKNILAYITRGWM